MPVAFEEGQFFFFFFFIDWYYSWKDILASLVSTWRRKWQPTPVPGVRVCGALAFLSTVVQHLANHSTIIPNKQLLTSRTMCHMELLDLWGPEGLGALWTLVSSRGCDSAPPEKGNRVTRQGGINPRKPHCLSCGQLWWAAWEWEVVVF